MLVKGATGHHYHYFQHIITEWHTPPVVCIKVSIKTNQWASVEITISGFFPFSTGHSVPALACLSIDGPDEGVFKRMCLTGGSRDVRVRFNMTISFVYCFFLVHSNSAALRTVYFNISVIETYVSRANILIIWFLQNTRIIFKSTWFQT